VAERLGVSRSTVAVALNHDDADRYQKTLAGIIEVFAGYSIRRQVRYTIEEK
jgi:DNA-binding LacI/PurR family transcriptional regulator